MRMSRAIWLAVCGSGIALAPWAQEAQSPVDTGQAEGTAASRPALIPRTHDDRERSYQARHRIILNVQVTDAQGEPARGLLAEDFAVLEKERPVKIASFRASGVEFQNERAHALIVLDAVNNSARTLKVEQRELQKYLEGNSGRLKIPTSLVILSAKGAKSAGASRDPKVLLEELRNAREKLHAVNCGDRGGIESAPKHSDVDVPWLDASPRAEVDERRQKAECLNHRFTTSVSALDKIAREEAEVPGRTILIWLGEGWPLLLGEEFAPDTRAEERRRFDYLADLSASLREAQITLDAVSSPDLFRRKEPGAEKLESVPAPTTDVAHTEDFALARLVQQTGGRNLEYENLAREIAASLADADSYYVVAFDSEPAEGAGEYRSLEVKVDRPELRVRTNAAYFARP